MAVATKPHGLAAIIRTYGNPRDADGSLNERWAATNVVQIEPPYQLYYQGRPVRQISIHRLLADELTAIYQEIWNSARLRVKQTVGFNKTTAEYDILTKKLLRNLGLDAFDGTFVFRPIRGSSRLSTHAFAISIDIDAAHNPLGATKGRMPSWVVDIFAKRGWLWGGRYKGRKDWMHFQACTGY